MVMGFQLKTRQYVYRVLNILEEVILCKEFVLSNLL